MKKFFLLLMLTGLFTRTELNAQYQHFRSMPYQGVARDPSGNPVANQTISVRFILQYGLSNAYIETQSLTTNAFGVFAAQIGAGTPQGGTFPSYDAIDWSAGNFAGLGVDIDILGGTNYVPAGGTQLRSVPFAALAEQSFALVDSTLYAATLTGDVIMKPTAQLGLGTETPQSMLDVEGGAAIGASYSGTNAAPANGLLVEGNVGIGNNNPQAKLHVTGSVRIANGSQGANRVLTSDASGNATWATAVSSGSYVPSWVTYTGFTGGATAGSCTYTRVGTMVNVVCRLGAVGGGGGPVYAPGTNAARISLPAGLPVLNGSSGGMQVCGIFGSNQYWNGSVTNVGMVTYDVTNTTSVRLTIKGATAGESYSYCQFSYETSAP